MDDREVTRRSGRAQDAWNRNALASGLLQEEIRGVNAFASVIGESKHDEIAIMAHAAKICSGRTPGNAAKQSDLVGRDLTEP